MNRRTLLTTAAVLPVVPAAAVAQGMVVTTIPSPDAELIEIGREALPLAQEFERLSELCFQHGDDGNDDDDPSWAIYERLRALSDRAALLPATTLQGFRAKAILRRHDLYIQISSPNGLVHGGLGNEMLWNLLTELQGAA